MYLNQLPPSVSYKTPEGRNGVRFTLRLMRLLVNSEHGKKNPVIRNKALELVKYIPQKDSFARVRALWNYVKENIKYVKDINEVETVHYPTQVLAQKAGDCDDHSLLLASLLESVGYPTLFKAVGVRGSQLCHVYTQVHLGNKWISLETTVPGVAMGWEPPDITDRELLHNKR